jgi:glycosyltransferase involved in cell wall biosynthesis
MSTLHILGSPYSPTHINNRIDPFSIAALKFITYMMNYGWRCIHYSVVGSEVPCENVICNDRILPERPPNTAEFNRRAGPEIAKRKQPGDMIICFHGVDNKGACDQNPDLKAIEPSIGYDTKAVFAPYRAFVSTAQMHMFYGERGMLMSPSWFDAVIPNAMTASEFDYCEEKEDYLLFFGRVMETKGVILAIQVAEHTGQRLVIAGPGTLQSMGYTTIPNHVEMVGLCDAEQRRKLMSKAKAIIGPTYYIEPFGNMITEGFMSGTPAITTDWGGFCDTVINGYTGYRCREFREFTSAINNIGNIKPSDCRDWAMKNYEDSVVHEKLHNYITKIRDSNFYR